MKRNTFSKTVLLVLLFAFIDSLLIGHVQETGRMHRLTAKTIKSDGFRAQSLNSDILAFMEQQPANQRGASAGLYLLESKFGHADFPIIIPRQK